MILVGDYHPIRMKKMLNDGKVEGVLGVEPDGVRRQDQEPVYIRNCAVYVFQTKTIKNNQSVKIKSFGLPEKQFSGLISNTDLKGFRVVRSDFSFDGEKVSIHRNLINTLKLGTNSKVAINV